MMNNIITFGGSMTAQINFALQQNYVPVFRSIVLTNNSDEVLEQVSLRIVFEPEFAHSFESGEFTLRPHEPVEIAPVNIALMPEYLFSLTEKLMGYARIEAVKGGEVIGRELKSVELLAYDQWTGVNFMPETAAAFVTPNHPKVTGIVSKASLFLQKWTGDPAFTGYQSRNPNIVRQQMGAIYAALQAENIAYATPPASFEQAQRVRLPDAVLENKCGTCLDLSILYCSCLEAVGLNSLLIAVEGHAFAGCWLEGETFSDCLEYDMTALTKRIAAGINSMSLLECTDLTAGRSVDFDDAEKHAADSLKDPSKFYFAIDIERTRSGGIRPIPSRVAENGTFKAVDYGERSKKELTAAPTDMELTPLDVNGEPVEVTKQMIWERKLLDLSLRNSLLNFRPTTSNVQLMIDDLSSLEDEIADGEEFRVMAMPNDMTLEISDSKVYETENHREFIADIAQNEFKSCRLRTFMSETELEKVMKKLHRLAKVSMEENGANTIYLALGFLKWFETDKAEKIRYAPLVLVPVDIIKRVQDKSYSIKIRDEDTQINITLLEMLRQFFGIDIHGLDPVPEDERGVDLPKIFSIFRQGVMARPRWDIEEYAFIGQFSFNRFIMWNDIRNRADELAENKVVASLISGRTEWESEDISISPLELDNSVKPSDVAAPVAADSSQLAAVVASSQGKSFVLHGPPGTGKSQTITNMIANALYNGKSVLFVAEKMAALSVVEKRLDKIGLGPFCLELHSNKAQKRAVLNQLDETLNVGRIKKPQDYQAQADKLYELRKELNAAMEELHKVRPCGFSAYDAVVRFEQNREFEGRIEIAPDFAARMNSGDYDKYRELTESLANIGSHFTDEQTKALGICRLTECTPDTRGEAERAVNSFTAALADPESVQGELCELTGSSELNYEQTLQISKMISEAASGKGYLLPDIVSGGSWDMVRAQAEKLIACGEELSRAKTEVLKDYETAVLDYDSSNALVRWKAARAKWFLPKSTQSKKLVKELAAYAKEPSKITRDSISGEYEKLNKIKELSGELAKAQPNVTAVFGALWQGENSSWETLRSSVTVSESIRRALDSVTLEAAQKQALAAKLTDTGYSDKLKAISAKADMSAAEAALAELEDKYKFDRKRLTGGSIGEAGAKCAAFISQLGVLKDWTVAANICVSLENAGLGAVSEGYLSGSVPARELVRAYDCGISKAVISGAVSGSDKLRAFSGAMFEDTVRRCGEVQDSFRKLTIQEVAAKLSANVPAPGESAKSSELGILQRAIKSGGRMMSIRKLFDSIPTLLRRICPCMLMSPISVAQYIDPAYPKFDLVIFDEASQLPTCEAVGAIARGENVIVVGDPKQLPPTSFFSTNQTDEENYEKEDLESVLDDCLALSMPQMHLLWHYRSRHESLIAYSNSKYYGNDLYTFPSPDDQISEVSHVQVEGYYDKGSTKQNKAEAKAIVEEITRRLRDEQLRKHSIGVVTFSLPQQNLIDDMLSDAFREEPQLEEWANEMYEPLLIKNLENVQGDERDVIFFSIGYGPDKEGRVSMNFGPLNRDGGWRRLNVAISRAREKMVVYSVMTPEMIDLSRTRSDGVEGLKGFLEFAARGKSSLPVKAGAKTEESGFERIVAAELEKRGYTVKCSVGCSKYKIDAAVADPEDKDAYILGINCCSRSYYENSTAYDRSISQPSVLKGLGWSTMNVYIMDWLDNRQNVLDRIEAEIKKAVELKRAPAPEEDKKQQALVFETEEVKGLSDMCAEYVPFEVKNYGDSEGFNEANTAKITACINEVLTAEAPVSKNALAKKVYACWGINRAGAAMKRTFEAALANSKARSENAGQNEYLWLDDQTPESYDICRAKCPDEHRRDMADIAPEETGAGIILIMSRQAAMAREDLIREVARLFGFTRVTPTIETAAALGIRSARQKGKIEFSEDGKVKYI